MVRYPELQVGTKVFYGNESNPRMNTVGVVTFRGCLDPKNEATEVVEVTWSVDERSTHTEAWLTSSNVPLITVESLRRAKV